MMDKITKFLDKYISTPMAKFSAQRHVLAIRDGMISSMPFIIVGSLFLILMAPPLPEGNAVRDWLMQFSPQFNMPFRVTMFIMSLYTAFGIGHALAKSYELDSLSGGQLAVLALLLTNLPMMTENGWMMPLANLGGAGLFVTMIVSVLAVEILRFCKVKNITIKMPDSVPPAISRSFATLFPAAIVIIVVSFFTVFLDINLHTVIGNALSGLVLMGDTLPGMLFLVFLVTFFWAFGIHGMAIIGTIARPFWLMYAEANATALAAGEALPHVAPETFYQWFVWIGGAGASLGLIIAALIVGRSQFLKTISRACLVPGLFNINEPAIFGFPIMLNPVLIIPFMVAPLVLTLISYFATVSGIVAATSTIAPWTLPAPIGAFIATNGSVPAIFLVIINVIIATLIYIPFVKIYDNKMLAEEQAE